MAAPQSRGQGVRDRRVASLVAAGQGARRNDWYTQHRRRPVTLRPSGSPGPSGRRVCHTVGPSPPPSAVTGSSFHGNLFPLSFERCVREFNAVYRGIPSPLLPLPSHVDDNDEDDVSFVQRGDPPVGRGLVDATTVPIRGQRIKHACTWESERPPLRLHLWHRQRKGNRRSRRMISTRQYPATRRCEGKEVQDWGAEGGWKALIYNENPWVISAPSFALPREKWLARNMPDVILTSCLEPPT